MSFSTQKRWLRWYSDEISDVQLTNGTFYIYRAEEVNLSHRIREGDKSAVRKLVIANLDLVVLVAKRFRGHGLLLQDLVGEGNLGLIKAAKQFDANKGKFNDYAVLLIRQKILQALHEKSRQVRLPSNRVRRIYNVGRASRKLLQSDFKPTIEEVAEGLGDEASLVYEACLHSQRYIRITELRECDGADVCESLASQGYTPDRKLFGDSTTLAINQELSRLSPREAEVVRLYFGLIGDYELTLHEIGKRFGLTRERIRQIKNEALRKLRQDDVKERLRASVVGDGRPFREIGLGWIQTRALMRPKGHVHTWDLARNANAFHIKQLPFGPAPASNKKTRSHSEAAATEELGSDSTCQSQEQQRREEPTRDKQPPPSKEDVLRDLLDNTFLD